MGIELRGTTETDTARLSPDTPISGSCPDKQLLPIGPIPDATAAPFSLVPLSPP
jgi:hypothetical protein